MSIEYKNILDLGFKREDITDNVFFNQYGFTCFYMTLKLSKGFYLDWDCNNREVEFIRHEKGNIKNKVKLSNLKTLQLLISFFKDHDTECLSHLEINQEKMF